MEFGGNSQSIDQVKKGNRRTWTKQEEDALIGVLEDVVAKGYRYENGSLKPGTTTIIEKALSTTFPTCGLKANPHIESKLKVWKKQYNLVYDMLSKSGFHWNDVKKCVEVDSDEVWQSYVQHHKGVHGWRGRYFPLYEKLLNIYGDHATPPDMVEKTNQNHIPGDTDREEESPFSANQTSSTNSAVSSRRKRKTPSDNISESLVKLAESIDKMVEKSNELVEKMIEITVEGAKKKENHQHNLMWKELIRLEIPLDDCIDVLDILVEKPWAMNVLSSLTDDKKLNFVTSLLKRR
ncbi:uncharacterized protein LOC133781365 [Humulus lupulus]|uniref:uncharacterized protein LOC133781365 n=1 Tax=Humulus lupulus TaxID=3486 RepID=UPI002B415437|nr:uncharacterized protein LOC133781365 [Humulus lupulus]XP_062076319.1 uncharacterized protein LOC133781365 [Humulus lupulus]XP_062076320.1 uncharacterized protein LOC133781365 [Humulus lupulus]XP_062076321.1 uncharacterized protein LOC133781365 [Humulus lupulus]XP_062076322.1 uncharacterized protein LOC133781365 [Humulus lupulus]